MEAVGKKITIHDHHHHRLLRSCCRRRQHPVEESGLHCDAVGLTRGRDSVTRYETRIKFPRLFGYINIYTIEGGGCMSVRSLVWSNPLDENGKKCM